MTLPDQLKPGDKIQCTAPAYTGNEILEVFKVDGDRIYLMRGNGVAVHGEFFLHTLKAYDYQLIIPK